MCMYLLNIQCVIMVVAYTKAHNFRSHSLPLFTTFFSLPAVSLQFLNYDASLRAGWRSRKPNIVALLHIDHLTGIMQMAANQNPEGRFGVLPSNNYMVHQ